MQNYLSDMYEADSFGVEKEANPKTALNPNYDWAFIPLFEYYAVNEDLDAKLKDYPVERNYDLIYFGNNRHLIHSFKSVHVVFKFHAYILLIK